MDRKGLSYLLTLVVVISASGVRNLQIQTINNISLTNVDFKYFLTWNLVTIFDKEIRNPVQYNVSAKVSLSRDSREYNFKAVDNTQLSFILRPDEDSMKWIFTITAIYDGHVVGSGEKSYFGLNVVTGVPASFSAPLLNVSNDCGNTTAIVALKRRFDDLISKDLKFQVQYFHDSLTESLFDMKTEEADYDSIMATFTHRTSKARNICVVGRYTVLDGGEDIESAPSQRKCAPPLCIEDDLLKDEHDPQIPAYFNVLIGVAVVAVVLVLMLLMYNVKKYVWNPWKGKTMELPQTTNPIMDNTLREFMKQVMEYLSDDQTFSNDWHQSELLSKEEPVQVGNLVECHFIPCHESEIALEGVRCESTKTDYIPRSFGDLLENPTYEQLSDDYPTSILLRKSTSSFIGVKQNRKGSVDSAFSENMSLQTCRSRSNPLSSTDTDACIFSDQEPEEGYIKFPEENQQQPNERL